MCTATRARLGPYCCELIPILIGSGPSANAVALDIAQSKSVALHRVSAVVFIGSARRSTRRTAQSCQGDATRSEISPKAPLVSRGAYRCFRRLEHAADQRQSRSPLGRMERVRPSGL